MIVKSNSYFMFCCYDGIVIIYFYIESCFIHIRYLTHIQFIYNFFCFFLLFVFNSFIFSILWLLLFFRCRISISQFIESLCIFVEESLLFPFYKTNTEKTKNYDYQKNKCHHFIYSNVSILCHI